MPKASALVGVALVFACLAPTTGVASIDQAADSHQRVPVVDEEPDCLQIPPERTPSPDAADTRTPLTLAATVLIAPSDLAAAKERMELTQRIYATIGVRLHVTFRKTTGPTPRFTGDFAQVHEDALAFAKRQVKGIRPALSDVVLYLSSQINGTGQADCIGGIAHPEYAFAVAGLGARVPGRPLMVDDGTVAAHEIGHLLGAHHHYGNCVEAQPAVFLESRNDTNPCTLMFVNAITPKVATLEAMYIRDYIRAYARAHRPR